MTISTPLEAFTKKPNQDQNFLPSLEVIEIRLAELKLSEFIKQAWQVVEPKTSFADGWHLHAICDHLEAVSKHQIKKLIINIPPRHMKSLAVSVFWPCWEWITNPCIRWLFASYAQSLSVRDSLKCRRLILSKWYQDRWTDRYKLTGDQNEKMRFENDRTGYRISTSVDGLGTGEGGDRIVVDDPHNVKEGESVLKRVSVLTWWDDVMSTRLNDERTGAKVIVMQRVHENDLTGHILSQENDYVHLCLPARYEGKSAVINSPIDFEDPRKKEGEVLWKERFPKEVLDDREKGMSQYAIAGQHQQRPSPRGGGMFPIEKFGIVEPSRFNKNTIVRSVRYWDKAGTEDGGKYTCGCLMHKLHSGKFLVSDIKRGQWSSGKREQIIKQTAMIDGNNVAIYVEQEPGSGGKESAENTVRNLSGFNIRVDKVTGAKEDRAEPYAAQVEWGNIELLRAEWNSGFLQEHELFPNGTYTDQVDSVSGSFNKLNSVKRAGVWGVTAT